MKLVMLVFGMIRTHPHYANGYDSTKINEAPGSLVYLLAVSLVGRALLSYKK